MIATIEKQKLQRLTVAVAISVIVGLMPLVAQAHDQTSWIKTEHSSSSSCVAQYVAGYTNFCRDTGGPSTVKLNRAVTRDSWLRTTGDTYVDSWYVGNLSGTSANTLAVRNQFSAGNPIKRWTAICYSGNPTTINPGSSSYPSSGNNLIGFAAAAVTGCHQ